MYSFTINKKAYKIPSLASELSLGQFVALQDSRASELDVLSILLGETPTISVDNEKEAKAVCKEVDNAYKLIDLLQQNVLEVVNSGTLLVQPKRIELLGLDVEIKPNFINKLPYWGFAHTRKAIVERAQLGKDEAFDGTDLIPGILAHNLYELATKNRYNEARAEEFIEVVNELGFIEAIQLGNFFLLQQRSLWTSRQKRWTLRLSLWKYKLASKFLKSTVLPISSKPFPEGIF